MSVSNGEPPHPERVLTVSDRRVGDSVVLTAAGEVDIASAPRLREALLAAIRRPDAARVVLDINGLTFLGSRGLAALLGGLDEAGRLGKTLLVAIRDQSPVYRVLEVTGVDKELARFETVEQALRPD